jgi:hypothetical protein
MTELALCSKGSLILAAKEHSLLAPSLPACMMPPPPPVMIMYPLSAAMRLKRTHFLYIGSSGRVRAEPKMVTFFLCR